jgi:hypothetical protein
MDTVYTIHIRSFGHLHPGRERLRVQVLKRAWPHIPGSTLYGALAAALIRLDGVHPMNPLEGDGGFAHLLQFVVNQQIRFAPCLASPAPILSAAAYCRTALLPRAEQPPLFQTSPHAPTARRSERIYEDQLFAYSNHRPVVDYYGFVFAPAAAEPLLRRALRLLPMIPVGGKGKYSLVQGKIFQQAPRDQFEAAFENELRHTSTPWVELLTPLLLQSGQDGWLLTQATESIIQRLRRYQIWQSGWVYDWRPEAELRHVGDTGYPGERDDLAVYPGGQESQALQGIPEGSRFRLPASSRLPGEIAHYFIEGVGHPGWGYLGWGQLVVAI